MKTKTKKVANKLMVMPWPWTLAGQGRLVVDGKTLQLSIAIEDAGHHGWLALALVGPNKKYKTIGKAADEILGNHSHQVLGTFDSVEEAMRRSEKYAADWLSKNGSARKGVRPV